MNPLSRRNAIAFGLFGTASVLKSNNNATAQDAADRSDDTPESDTRSLIVPETDAAPQAYDAGTVRFLADRSKTGAAWSTIELTEMPNYRTPMHRHRNFDELYYVVEGTLTAQVEDKIHQLAAGSFLYLPRGVAHAQGNLTDKPVKTLLTLTPGGFESFFTDRVELHKTIKPDDPKFVDHMTAIANRHDLEFIAWWDPRVDTAN